MSHQSESARSLEQVREAAVAPYTYESLDACALELSRLGSIIAVDLERAFDASVRSAEQAAA